MSRYLDFVSRLFVQPGDGLEPAEYGRFEQEIRLEQEHKADQLQELLEHLPLRIMEPGVDL